MRVIFQYEVGSGGNRCFDVGPGAESARTGRGAGGSVKIAIINIRNAIVATAEGKQAQAQLQSQFAPKQNELQSMQKQIEDLQRRMTEGAAHAQ